MAHKSTFFQYDWSMHYLYILPSVCTLSDRFYRFWTVEKLHTCNKHLLKSLIIFQCLRHFLLLFLERPIKFFLLAFKFQDYFDF